MTTLTGTSRATAIVSGEFSALPPELAADQDLARGRLLLELDQRGDALTALERVYQRNSDNPRALYPLSLEFARLGAYRLSLLAATRLLIRSGAGLVEDGPIFIQRLAYPQPFADLIVREAQANGIWTRASTSASSARRASSRKAPVPRPRRRGWRRSCPTRAVGWRSGWAIPNTPTS